MPGLGGHGRLRRLVIGLFVVAAFVGCGKRGSPKPPLPRGPHPPGEVIARQIGRRAVVGFTVPRPKGPHPAQECLRAELIRVTYHPGFQPPADPDAFRRRGEVVGQVASDPLPAGDRLVLEDLRLDELDGGGRGWTLRYGVRVKDRRGRSSALIVTDDLELLPSAAAPRDLTVEPTADGVRIVWNPPSDDAPLTYNVYRSDPRAPWPELPLNAEPLAATEFLDTTIATGRTYTYTVRVALSTGQPFREGEPSETREVVAVDRFAPRAPSGFVAVQEGLAVRLFWDPNPERDVAGYRVERSIEEGPWQSTDAPDLGTPSYLDTDVVVGTRVAYRVMAVDRADPPNVSEPSPVVQVEMVAEPVAPGREVP